MSRYIEGTLVPGETVLYTGHVSLWSLTWWIVLGFLLLPLWGVGLVFWIVAYVKYKTTELAITSKRVIAKFGFIGRHTVELNLAKIESIQVSQGVIGRVCNYGSLLVSGGGTPQAPIPDISDPLEFRRAFVEAQEKVLKRSAA